MEAVDRGVGGTRCRGLLLALAGAGLFILAAFAVMSWWVPTAWWPALAGMGAISQLVLMALFLAPTKLLPIAYDLLMLYLLWSRSSLLAAR